VFSQVSIKESAWRFLVRAWGILPGWIRALVCRLSFAAASGKDDAATALRELFYLDERLNWYINQTAIRYGGNSHPKHRLMDYHTFFTDRVRPGERVLDAGCGFGQVAFSLAKAGCAVTGIDFDRDRIAQAKVSFQRENLVFFCGDITCLSGKNSFDTIVLSNVLEHLRNREVFLRELHLKTGAGRLLVRVPLITRDWMVSMRRELGLFYFSDPTHETEYTVDDLKRELREGGIDLTEYIINWGEIWAEGRWSSDVPGSIP